MIVLDTTILAYAVGSDHALRNSCARILRAVSEGIIEATTTVEVIQEFMQVRSRRRSREDAGELALDFLDALSPLLVIDGDALRSGVRIFRSHPALGAFDSVLAAATIACGATAIASADAGFATLDEISHIDPASPNLDELLAMA